MSFEDETKEVDAWYAEEFRKALLQPRESGETLDDVIERLSQEMRKKLDTIRIKYFPPQSPGD